MHKREKRDPYLDFTVDGNLHSHHVGKIEVGASTRATRLRDEGWPGGGLRDLGGKRGVKRVLCLREGGL